nr:hybrid signal transduction histidine kinase M [Tanacetum cinerariifolium]
MLMLQVRHTSVEVRPTSPVDVCYFADLYPNYEVTKFLHDDLNATESSTVTPLIPYEIKVEKVILSWIFTTLSDPLQKRLWLHARQRLKRLGHHLPILLKTIKRSRTFAFKAELPPIKLGTLSMEAYFQKIDSLVTLITSPGSIVNDEDVVHYTVEGLSEKYNQVCCYMHYQDTFPDLTTVRSLLITEEMRLKSKVDALLMDSSSFMALMTESGNPHRSSSTPQVKPWKPCFHFAKGTCRFGDGCRFVHDANMKNTNNHGVVTKESTTDELLAKLLERLATLSGSTAIPVGAMGPMTSSEQATTVPNAFIVGTLHNLDTSA